MVDIKKPKISFEFFPPKSLSASFAIWKTLHMLLPLHPEFVSVTYGANGSTRDLTRDMTKTIAQTWYVDVAAHLTCVDATRHAVMNVAKGYLDVGVQQIVALRGDAPGAQVALPPRLMVLQTRWNLLPPWQNVILIGSGLVHIRNRILMRLMMGLISIS